MFIKNKREKLKFICAALAALFLVACVLPKSGCELTLYQGKGRWPNFHYEFPITTGCFTLQIIFAPIPSLLRTASRSGTIPGFGWTWYPRLRSAPAAFIVDLSYWYPFLFFLGIAIYLHRRRMRNSAERACEKCGYDLRMHAPGDRCPECGVAIPFTKGRKEPPTSSSTLLPPQ